MDAPVLVVGGGPVGATLGLLMPEALVVDAAEFPRDKACGEGLMPAGVAVLRAAGVDLAAEGFPAVGGVSYRLPSGASARADFSTGTGFGTRRTRLDALLAERCGVRQGIRVEGVTVHPEGVEVRTSTGTISTSILVAADGLRSPVARMMGWWRPSRGRPRYAMVGHLRADPLSSDIEVSLLGDVETYMAPVGDGEILFAVLGAKGQLRAEGLGGEKSYRAVLARAHPQLAETPMSGRLRGAGPFNVRPARVAGPRVFLVGDAAGFLDPLTGDAMTAGLEQALALALLLSADREGAVERYQSFWARQWRRRALVSALARRLSGSPWLGRRAVTGIAHRPEALQALMAVNEGSRGLSSIRARDWAALLGLGGK